VVRWFGGSVVRWFGGSVVRWFGGSVVRWFGGSVKPNYRVAQRQPNYRVAQRQPNYRAATPQPNYRAVQRQPSGYAATELLPLNTRRWLGRDIVQHAVDAFDFVQNPMAGLAKDFIREFHPISGHRIF
jgi:hypothetical protein